MFVTLHSYQTSVSLCPAHGKIMELVVVIVGHFVISKLQLLLEVWIANCYRRSFNRSFRESLVNLGVYIFGF